MYKIFDELGQKKLDKYFAHITHIFIALSRLGYEKAVRN